MHAKTEQILLYTESTEFTEKMNSLYTYQHTQDHKVCVICKCPPRYCKIVSHRDIGIYKKVKFSNGHNSKIFTLKKHQHKKEGGFHIKIFQKWNKNAFVKIHYTQKRKKISHIVEEYGNGYLNTNNKTMKQCIINVFEMKRCDSGMAEIIATKTRLYASNNNWKYRPIRVKENIKGRKLFNPESNLPENVRKEIESDMRYYHII